jgi:hypothetical protein
MFVMFFSFEIDINNAGMFYLIRISLDPIYFSGVGFHEMTMKRARVFHFMCEFLSLP